MTTRRRGRRRRRAAPPPRRAAMVALASSLAQRRDDGAIQLVLAAAAAPLEDDRELRGDTSLQRLATVFSGDRAASGAMFDMRAKKPIQIRGMDIHAVQTATEARVEIWTKPGGFRGYDNDPSAWTLWLNATIATMGADVPTPIPRGLLDPLTVDAGEQRAFYVSFPDGPYLRYSSSDMGRQFYINHDLLVYGKSAIKRKGSFVGNTIAPRLFNGALYYETLEPGEPLVSETETAVTLPPSVSMTPTRYPTLRPTAAPSVSVIPTQYPTLHPTAAPFGTNIFTTEFDSSATYAGVMFDVEGKENCVITNFAFNTYKETPITVRLYTKPGTYVGADKDITQWTLVVKTTVLGNGLDTPTYLPEGAFDSILVRRKKQQAFYITAEGPYLRSGKGTASGRKWKANTDLIVFEGAGKRYPITEHTFSARLWNGQLQYHVVDIPTLEPTSSPSARPTRKPTPSPTPKSFRLRLYWQKGYYWQESRREMWYCMEWRGANGDAVYVDHCDGSPRQQFASIGNTIRPTVDASLCLTRTGYSEDSPIRVKKCDGRSDQQWDGFKYGGRFELHPKGSAGRCVSQMHHPKPKERIYPEECRKTRDHDTTYWITY